MFSFLKSFLMQKWALYALLLINFAGTIYGYYWYKSQLIETPWYFIPFVPDSPTASLFFCFVLVGLIIGKNFGLFEALALMSLFKYGIWAVVMNLLVLFKTDYLTIDGFMLIFSHAAMALQGLLYAPHYRIKKWHLILAGIFLVHNEIIDYVYEMMPSYRMLSEYMSEIGYFTFWLSIISILVTYYVYEKNKIKN